MAEFEIEMDDFEVKGNIREMEQQDKNRDMKARNTDESVKMESIEMSKRPPVAVYLCDQCSYQTSNVKRFTSHRLSHSGHLPYACDKCDFKTAHHSHLNMHKRSHEGKNMYTCNMCTYTTSSNGALKTHRFMHTGEKPFSCKLCSFKSVSSKSLKVHEVTHSSERPFACDQCSYTSKTLPGLKNHKLRHTQEKPFSCDNCPKSFKSISLLRNHQKSHLDPNDIVQKEELEIRKNQLQCNLCGYKNSSKGAMKVHAVTHTGVKPYACDQCDFATTLSHTLTTHKLIHLGLRPFKCSECDYATRTSSQLGKHALTHSGARPHACPHCSYTAAILSTLKLHLRRHTGEKPFACNHCDYNSRTKSAMRNHKKTHLVLKPFACKLCTYRCRRSVNMYVHMKNVHGKRKFTRKSVIQKIEELCLGNNDDGSLRHETEFNETASTSSLICDNLDVQIDEFDQSSVGSSSSNKLYEEKQMQNDEEYLRCDRCAFKCNRLSELSKHMKKHRDQIGSFDTVKYLSKESIVKKIEQLYSRNELNINRKPLKGSKSKAAYYCVQCDYKFSNQTELKCHQKTHTSRKTLFCDYCSYTCGTLSQMSCHMTKHPADINLSHKIKKLSKESLMEEIEKLCSEEKLDNSLDDEGNLSDADSVGFNESEDHWLTEVDVKDDKLDDVKQELMDSDEAWKPPKREIDSEDLCVKSETRVTAKVEVECMKVGDDQDVQGFDQKNEVKLADSVAEHINVIKVETSTKMEIIEGVSQSGFTKTANVHSKKVAKKQANASTARRRLLCDQCSYQTCKVKNFQLHLLSHNGHLPFACPECDFKTAYEKHLIIHKKAHAGKNLYTCSMCTFCSTTSGSLKIHQFMHSGEKPFTCKLCDYSTTTIHNLRHHEVIHNKAKPISCDQCNYTCKRPADIRRHKLMHAKFSCSKCPKSYPKRSMLVNHEMHAHPTKNSNHETVQGSYFKCEHCDHSCTDRLVFLDHAKIHKKKPYSCDKCNFSTAQSYTLKCHKLTHSSLKPFKCSQCDYSSRTKVLLKKHAYKHTGIKPYSCPHCDYKSTHGGLIKSHIRSHTGEKPYACDQCSFRSAHLNSLKTHRLVHNPHKPLSCEHCDYRCHLLKHMRLHMNSHRFVS